MTSPWTIYLISRLDTISEFFGVGIVVVPVVSILILLVMAEAQAEDCHITRFLTFAVALWAAFIFGALLVPNSKQMAAIIILPRIINNEDIQALGSDLPKLAREWLETLRPEKAAEQK